MNALGELIYPLEARPEPDQALEVAPGVLWFRLPLPFTPNHVNVWGLRDHDGWTIADTGVNTPQVASAWENLCSGAMDGAPVRRVICTHMHPDHVGMAGWLTNRFSCRLWMTRLEYLTCRTLVADSGREAPPDGVNFHRAAGWDSEQLERYKSNFGGFGNLIHSLPNSYRRIVDGEEIQIGSNTWQVVVGTGHCPEHACLYCPALRVLISGDQVLPRISSNVSVYPTEPDADPLSDWLESLSALEKKLPDDVLVLPSHNEPFYGLHLRLNQLQTRHEDSLTSLLEILAEAKRAVDVFPVLFKRRIHSELLGMATGESVAHLNCLIRRGLAVREMDEAGVAWYRRS